MKKSVRELSQSALLIALGIIIPMFMPKIQIEPASYTIASHVPVFIAMFLSPKIAVAVVFGTAWGFLISTTPVIALRALSHLIFAFIGATYLQKDKCKENVLSHTRSFLKFNLSIALIHACAETIVVFLFYLQSPIPSSHNLFFYLLGLVGFGGFIHSIIDLYLAKVVLDRIIL